MAKLIVIEGLDGFGKTTIAKELAEKEGFQYLKADTSTFKRLSDSEKKQIHPMRRFLYYLSAYSDISEQVRLSGKNDVIVTDRYIPSLQVYNGKLAGKDLSNLIEKFDLIPPNIQILLIGDEEHRKNRVENREQEKSDWDMKIQKDSSTRKDLMDRYFHFCKNASIVLNTGRSIDETILEIKSYINHEFVDLHTHTSVVDGVLSPAEIIERAKSKGLKAVAITDHDALEGIPEARRKAKDRDIEFIPGVEITAKEFGYNLHILGYFIDETNPKLIELIQEQRGIRRKSLEEKCSCLQELGFDLSLIEIVLQSPQRYIGKKNIAYNIIKNPRNKRLVEKYVGEVIDLADAIDSFKEKIFEANDAPLKKCYTPAITITNAISAIHKAGGLAFIAHPHKRLNPTTMYESLVFLKNKGIDGMETTTTFMNPEEITNLLVLANKLDLLCSGGSNYHTDWNKEYANVNKIEIGSGVGHSLYIPYYFVEKMKERLR